MAESSADEYFLCIGYITNKVKLATFKVNFLQAAKILD